MLKARREKTGRRKGRVVMVGDTSVRGVRNLPPRLGLALILVVLTSCAGSTDRLDGWYGRHIDDLARLWGPPDASQRQQDGQQRFKYSFARILSDVRYHCTTIVKTDGQGVIRGASQRGNQGGCAQFMKSMDGG